MEQQQVAANPVAPAIDAPNIGIDIENKKRICDVVVNGSRLHEFTGVALSVFIELVCDDVTNEPEFCDKSEAIQIREIQRRLKSPQGVASMLGAAFLHAAGLDDPKKLDFLCRFADNARLQSTQANVIQTMYTTLDKVLNYPRARRRVTS